MSEVVGIALGPIPFLNSCDSTRLQMAQKYVMQALPHENSEIPSLLSTDTYKLSIYCDNFIKFAKDDGIVIYSDDDIIIVYFKNLKKAEVYYTPLFLNTYSKYSTKLKFKLKINDEFKKGDVIYEYEGFNNGIPTSGFNTLIAFSSFFLYNYEDAIIISESYAKRARNYVHETLIIPIYENSVLKENCHGKFLPDIGDKFNEDDAIVVVGEKSKPNDIVDLLIKNEFNHKRDINDNVYSVEFNGAVVYNVEVHKVSKLFCVDEITEKILLDYSRKTEEKISSVKEKLSRFINDQDAVNDIVKKYYKIKKRKSKLIKNIKNVAYIIKVDLYSDEIVLPGDKFSTRGANKGVVSIVIPDELMPKTEDGKVIDMMISPFAIPSRMNVNQIYEFYIAKIVKFCEDLILGKRKIDKKLLPKNVNYDEYVCKILPLTILKDVISKFSIETKAMQLKYIDKLLNDDKLYSAFKSDVRKNGLYIIVDSFKSKNMTKKDILEIYKKYSKYGLKLNEKIYFNPKKVAKFLTGQEVEYLPDKTIAIDASIGYMYVYKLQHLARYKMNARSVGPYQKILKLPTRGRAKQGGSRIGNDEINILLTYKADNILKEFSTIKADDHQHKKEYIVNTARGEKYSIKDIKSESYVKLTVDAIMKSLFCEFEKEK